MKNVGPIAVGALLESFVVSEFLKLASWSERRVSFSHYRTKDQDEVGVVIEDRRGRVAGFRRTVGGCASCRKESAIVLCAGWCCTTITV